MLLRPLRCPQPGQKNGSKVLFLSGYNNDSGVRYVVTRGDSGACDAAVLLVCASDATTGKAAEVSTYGGAWGAPSEMNVDLNVIHGNR